jgi:glucokinase
MLLAGDIGGTKTLLALYGPEADARRPIAEAEFRSRDFASLELMARAFLERVKHGADQGCFDVAGPVIGGRAQLTNLPWMVDEAVLCRNLGMRRVTLLNDLQAVAYAVPRLRAEERQVLHAGTPRPGAPIAVVAPGTGLGEAFVIRHGGDDIACPSEGGHASFAPTDEDEVGLWRFLAQRFGHVSVERVCSGPGIAHIYDFLCAAGPGGESPAFAARLAAAADRTPLIVQAALDDPAGNPLAARAVDMFVGILGGECANLALKVLATGGVYLAGGIPMHILPLLAEERFRRAFVGKGRLANVLRDVPVHVVTARAALLGAALYGLEQGR